MKIRKTTKSFKEYTRLYKNLSEQARYYKKLGVDLPSVADVFKRSDGSYKNLQSLKKFRTSFLSRVRQVKKDVSKIKKTLGVSTSTAYKIYSKDIEKGPLKYEDVVIANFKFQVEHLPNLDARKKLSVFINEYEQTFEDRQELARILQDTAENDRAFETLQDYVKTDVLAFNLNELMSNLISHKQDEIINKENLIELMDKLI